MEGCMEYQVVLEKDEETKHYTATVTGLPIVVDATSKKQAISMAKEAIEIYNEETRQHVSPTIHAELVTVKV